MTHFPSLSIDGRPHTCPNSKEGLQQAILDGLATAPTLTTANGQICLSSNIALEVVAAILYPEGIETEEAYQRVCRIAEKACARAGYGPEVELGPPHVPFAARGLYRPKVKPVDRQKVKPVDQQVVKPVDRQMMLDELAQAGRGYYRARLEVERRSLAGKASWALYGRSWSELTEDQQRLIRGQVEAIVLEAGWQPAEDDDTLYVRPLTVDGDGARHQLTRYLSAAAGRPLPVRAVHSQAQTGAYGRAFDGDDLAPELAAIVGAILPQHGYQPEATGGVYRPASVAVTHEAAANLAGALAALPVTETVFGPALLWRDVLAAVGPRLGVTELSDWQAEELLQGDALGATLRRLGYHAELTWCRPYQFQPLLGDEQSHRVLFREVRVRHDPEAKLTFAGGLAVYTPALTVDERENTLVYLEMTGPKQSVKANWAALAGGGRGHWVGRTQIRLEGMKRHVRIQTALPCGWSSVALIHKQASLKTMNPEEPFYLLDDGRQPVPPLFYPMLNRSLALPLLASWTTYLWESGRRAKLLRLLDKGRGQGYAAWQVIPAASDWQEIVQEGIRRGEIPV